jgi:hypothetical protein
MFVEFAGAFDQFGIPDHRGERRAQVVRHGVNELTAHAIHFLQVGDILHGQGVPHLLNRCELGIAHAPIREPHFIITQRVVAVLAGEKRKQVRVGDHLERGLSPPPYFASSPNVRHMAGLSRRIFLLQIEDHHAVVDVIEHRFESRALGFGDLRALFERGGRAAHLAAEPVSCAVGVLQTGFDHFGNFHGFQRRG